MKPRQMQMLKVFEPKAWHGMAERRTSPQSVGIWARSGLAIAKGGGVHWACYCHRAGGWGGHNHLAERHARLAGARRQDGRVQVGEGRADGADREAHDRLGDAERAADLGCYNGTKGARDA